MRVTTVFEVKRFIDPIIMLFLFKTYIGIDIWTIPLTTKVGQTYEQTWKGKVERT